MLSLLHPYPLIKAICRWCREEYIAMGLFHVAKAVSFLNNDCNLVRGCSLPRFHEQNLQRVTGLCKTQVGNDEANDELPFIAQIHGNICMRAIVVTQSLDWRLHGFDLLCEHQPATGFEWPLMAASWMVGAQYKPAEVWGGAISCYPCERQTRQMPNANGYLSDVAEARAALGLRTP